MDIFGFYGNNALHIYFHGEKILQSLSGTFKDNTTPYCIFESNIFIPLMQTENGNNAIIITTLSQAISLKRNSTSK